MTELPPTGKRSSARFRLQRRTAILLVFGTLLLVLVGPAIVQWVTLATADLFADAAANPGAAYATVFALVWGDAVVPLLPGETTVTSAAVVAAGGSLEILWVCVAAALGAVVGDSTVYWIARSARGRVRARLERTASSPRARGVLEIFDERAALLIIVGRYVPGFRIIVNFTMGGVVRMPYPRFLRLSSLSGVLWGFYTGLLAYLVATIFDGRPLLSLVISGTVTSLAITWVLVVLRRDLVASRAAEEVVQEG